MLTRILSTSTSYQVQDKVAMGMGKKVDEPRDIPFPGLCLTISRECLSQSNGKFARIVQTVPDKSLIYCTTISRMTTIKFRCCTLGMVSIYRHL